MSEAVERRLLALLGHPTTSPFGNPIPGLAELQGGDLAAADALGGTLPGQTLASVAAEGDPRPVEVLRIGEILQSDEQQMALLQRVGATPGGRVEASRVGDQVRLGGAGDVVDLTAVQAAQVFVADGAEQP